MDALRKILSSFSGDSANRTTRASSANDAAPAFAASQRTQTTLHASGKVEMPGVGNLSGDEFEGFNKLPPWAAFVLDHEGRKSSFANSATQRNLPQAMPAPRIELDRRIPDYKRALATKGTA